MKDILAVNAHLKYVEHLLSVFDNESDNITLGEIRKSFKKKFHMQQPLLNQNFGVYRLLPLILMKEEYKNQKKELTGDILTIKVIRDAIAHHQYSISEQGYEFRNNKNSITLSYEEFTKFLYRVENNFYSENKS